MLPKHSVSNETSLKKSKKRCAIFKFSFRLRETTLCLEKSCLVYRPAKTLTWYKRTRGSQTNFAKFYISKLPIHCQNAAVTVLLVLGTLAEKNIKI